MSNDYYLTNGTVRKTYPIIPPILQEIGLISQVVLIHRLIYLYSVGKCNHMVVLFHMWSYYRGGLQISLFSVNKNIVSMWDIMSSSVHAVWDVVEQPVSLFPKKRLFHSCVACFMIYLQPLHVPQGRLFLKTKTHLFNHS